MPKRYRQLQMKNLPKVSMWQLERNSYPRPPSRKASTLPVFFVYVACFDVACIDVACIDVVCIDVVCIDVACIDVACIDVACIDVACIDVACIDVACIDVACRQVGQGEMKLTQDELMDPLVMSGFFMHPDQGLFLAKEYVQVSDTSSLSLSADQKLLLFLTVVAGMISGCPYFSTMMMMIMMMIFIIKMLFVIATIFVLCCKYQSINHLLLLRTRGLQWLSNSYAVSR